MTRDDRGGASPEAHEADRPRADYAPDTEPFDPADEPAPAAVASKGRVLVTPDGRLKSGRLAGLSMNRAIWVLAWPVLVESYLNSFVGLVDTALAARLSTSATDAIGAASYFAWFIGLVGMALGVGATALIARSVGKGRMAVANAAVGQTMVLAVALGSIAGACLWLASGLIARVLSLEGQTAAEFTDYLRIIAWGVPLSAVLMSGSACLRGAGDALRPLWAMVAVNVVNVTLSWGLAGVPIAGIVPPGSPELGLDGIALGTVIAHAVGAVVVLVMLTLGRGGVTLKRRRLKPHARTMGRLIRIGLPNFLESLGMWFGNFLIIVFVGWLALDMAQDGLFGAHILAIRVEAFSFLPGFAIGTAVATLAGQYLGAGSTRLAKTAILKCTLMGSAIMASMGAAFVFLPEQIIGVLSSQPVHMELAPPLLVICGLTQIPFAISMVIRSALRGAGDVHAVMWITWFATYGLRIPMAYAISGVRIHVPASVATLFGAEGAVVIDNPFGLEPSLSGLWIGLCGELVLRAMLFGGRLLHGGWKRARV